MNMKRIIYLALFSVLLFSCDDKDITLSPHNAFTEELVFQDKADFDNAIRGAYVKLQDGSGYMGEFIIDSECMTDNLIYSPQGRQTNLDGYRWQSTPSQPHFDYLEGAYQSSDMASQLINHLDILPAGAERDNYEGEARFLRALNHFDMVRSYSKIPTQSADALGSLGMYYLSQYEPFAKPARPVVSETYQKILDDLLIAKDKINADNGVAVGRAGKAAVYALLSRVYLYMGDYPNVIANGQLAISNATGAMSTVNAGTNFVNLWNDANVNGVLFKVRAENTDGVTPGTVFFQGSASNRKSEFVVTKEFFNLFTPTFTNAYTDIRKTAYLATSNFSGKAYNHVIKYDGRTGAPANLVDIKVLRIEEVYLNMAEAQYKINGGGLNYLDMVRTKRYVPVGTSPAFVSGNETGTALWDAIMKERRLELAFEFDRFYTLKRLALPMDRSTTDGHYADGSGVPATVTHIDAGDTRWQMPIPKYYRDLNRNYQQNPGY
jgi:hypothetical protein